MRPALIATNLAVVAAALIATTANSAPAEAHEPPAAASDSSPPTRDPPLIAYAIELSQQKPRSDVRSLHSAATELRTVEFEMSRHPPPKDEDCAQTLGASRFAQQYAELAMIQDQLGNFEAVIEANKSALACQPRVASYEASIASAHLNLDRIDEARAAVDRGYALNPEDHDVRDMRSRLDFIQERWADATARFRLQLMDEKYTASRLAEYSRCYLWLAQRRAGVRNPDVPATLPKVKEDGTLARSDKLWPTQILDTLRGELSEEELVQVIRKKGERHTQEWLTEALFYIGELRLAEGDVETARRHFATVVNLRVLNFVEYGMARAELQKMREHMGDTATAAVGTQAR